MSADPLAQRYHVVRSLGKGGMGEVLLVRDERGGPAGPELALKRLRLSDPEAAERFRDEFAILAGIEHPNIVRVLDYDVLPPGDGGGAYFTMEYLDGRSIDEAIAPGDVDAVLRATLDIADGLAALEAVGVVHCDLKPSNVILVDGPGGPRARLLDFGLSGRLGGGGAHLDAHGESAPPDATSVRGTPGYVAPELLTGGAFTPASDAYALGATLYRVLTGRLAFAGTNPATILAAQRAGRPSALPLRAVGVPGALESALLGLFEADPDRRRMHYATLLEVARRQTRKSAGSGAAHPARGVGARGAFVGRVAERERLLAHLFRDRIQLAVVRGAAGSGRTRLARELAVEAELRGWSVTWLDADSIHDAPAIYRPAGLERRGLLLVLDDVDRFPPDAFVDMGLSALRAPVAIVATVDAAREGEAWSAALLALPEDPHRRDVALGNLSADEVVSLVRSRLGERTPARLAEFLARQVGTRVADLHRALDMLLGAGALADEGGAWTLDEAAAATTLERGLAGDLALALAELGASTREVLLWLSYGLDCGSVAPEVVQALSWRGWLVESNGPPVLASSGLADRLRGELSPVASVRSLTDIASALARSTASNARSHRLRGEVALALKLVDDARGHLLMAARAAGGSEDPDAEVAVELLLGPCAEAAPHDLAFLDEVAEFDASRGRSRRAADVWGRILGSKTRMDPAARVDLGFRRAVVLSRIGDFAEALRTMDAIAAEGLGSGFDPAEWSARRAGALQYLGRVPEATIEFEKAIALLPPPDLARRARLENRFAMMLYLMADAERGRALLGTAMLHAAEAGDETMLATISGNFGLMARMEGDFVEAERRQREAIARHRIDGDGHELGVTLASLAATLAKAARWDELEAVAEEVSNLARTRRDPHLLLNLLATLIPASLRRGRIAEARGHQRTERTWLPAVARLEARLHHLVYTAERLRLQGRSSASRRALKQVLGSKDSESLPRYIAMAECMLGRLEARSGAHSRARERLVRALAIRVQDSVVFEIALLELARLASRARDPEARQAQVAEVDSWASAARTRSSVEEEIRGWRALAQGNVDPAIDHFRLAMAAYGESDDRILQVELGQLAGVAIAERGRSEAGIELLRGSHALARAEGLRAWARRIADEILELEGPARIVISRSHSDQPERDTLYRVSEVLNSALDPTALLPRALSLVCERMGAERGFILLHDESGKPRPVAQYGTVDEESRASALDVSRTVIRHVTTTGEAFRSDDAASDPRLSSTLSVLDLSMRSLVCVPMRLGDEGIGTIYLENRSAARQFEVEHLDLIEAFANVVAAAIQNARLHEELRRSRDRVLGENLSLRREVTSRFRSTGIIGQSAEIERALFEIERVAPSRATVLLTGESGTGKDLVAKTIHYSSPRAERPFLSLNCAAMPADLIESELFGIDDHVATGVKGRPGIFERADGGTLFLDEIGDMPLGLQAKLLRVLQEREFTRIGGARQIKVDVRLIAATNQDLAAMIRDGKFREDLFFRIHTLPIHLPPLRERKVDVPLLAQHFLRRFCEENSLPIPRMSPEFQADLLRSDWPGNVRELQNHIERSVVMSPGPTLEPVVRPSDLEPARGRERSLAPAPAESTSPPGDIRVALEAVERRWIEGALELARGNQRQAAALLGIAEPTLRYRMGRLGIVSARPAGEEPAAEPGAPRAARNGAPQRAARISRK